MTAPPAAARTVHVEHCMGTVFTVDVRDPGDWGEAVAAVVAWLHRVDATFSTYRPDSAISRIGRGELAPADAHPDVTEVLARCREVERVSGGYFTATPGGRLDPSGLVKGWAVERASALLRHHGARNHAVNGGGDVQLAGEAAPGRPWQVGVADPHRASHLLATVGGRDLAVATSGTAERGRQVRDPTTGRYAVGLASATVVGRSLTEADAYATAALAMGRRALGWVAELAGVEALLVTDEGRRLATPGWGRLVGVVAR